MVVAPGRSAWARRLVDVGTSRATELVHCGSPSCLGARRARARRLERLQVLHGLSASSAVSGLDTPVTVCGAVDWYRARPPTSGPEEGNGALDGRPPSIVASSMPALEPNLCGCCVAFAIRLLTTLWAGPLVLILEGPCVCMDPRPRFAAMHDARRPVALYGVMWLLDRPCYCMRGRRRLRLADRRSRVIDRSMAR